MSEIIKVGDTITSDATLPRFLFETVTGVVVEDADGSGSGPNDYPFYRVQPDGGGPVRHVRADIVTRVSEYRTGDRVRYTGARNHGFQLGVGVEGTVIEVPSPARVRVNWDKNGLPEGVFPENIEKIPPAFAFVGPEPEPAKALAVTTPFKVSESYPRTLTDSRGNVLTEFAGAWTSGREDEELAALVADLLNKHFNKALS